MMTMPKPLTQAFVDTSKTLMRTLPLRVAAPRLHKSTSSLEEALICMLPEVDLNPKVIKAAFNTNSASVVEAFVAHFGVERICRSRHDGYFFLNEVIKSARIESLKTLFHVGYPVKSLAFKMLPHAFRHGNLSYLSFIRETLGCKISHHEEITAIQVVTNCTPSYAAAIADEIRPELTDLSSGFVLDLCQTHTITLKAMAVLAFSHQDLSPVIDQDRLEKMSTPATVSLYHKTRSAHGRLQLLQKESDIVAVLGRPANGMFFGFSDNPHAQYAEETL
jgi:hypothetical protein